jgi:hypothetical protein
MPYRFIEIEFATPERLFDLTLPIDIYSELLSAAPSRSVEGSNFNKYYLPPDIPRPRIDLRINSDDNALQAAVLTKAQELVTAGRISAFSPSFRPWTEPEFVVKAHETATLTAVQFKEGIQQDQQLSTNYRSNRVEFLGYFLRELFQQAGGEFYIAWTFLRGQAQPAMRSLAQTCSEIVARLPDEYKHNADFLERYAHCFFNNVASSQDEQTLVNFVIASSIWKNVARSWGS